MDAGLLERVWSRESILCRFCNTFKLWRLHNVSMTYTTSCRRRCAPFIDL